MNEIDWDIGEWIIIGMLAVAAVGLLCAIAFGIWCDGGLAS